MRKILLVLVFVLTACGSRDAGAGGNTPAAPAAPPAPEAPTGTSAAGPTVADKPECTAADIKVAGKFGAKPEVTIPDTCAPPTKLVIKDLSAGSGKKAAKGSTVQTNYLLVTWSDKQVLDNSFDRGQPFPIEDLGHAQVIDGWNKGMIGIKEGGRRLLIIPPDLGYGPGGNGIQPNETLVFVVDAVKVT
ncbi:peptidylprolyl isomerase [Labedaea rhizosphaerae]|uniref:Peptidyl-prolyl cis-trans isomerase n=1 Tax=Labedaea rhizosphaerae TaxID=598644 RepID=A0A4R6SGG4_LABRH|nr:peptidylprolyl isomerase [Labedaea rhizosphaerae]